MRLIISMNLSSSLGKNIIATKCNVQSHTNLKLITHRLINKVDASIQKSCLKCVVVHCVKKKNHHAVAIANPILTHGIVYKLHTKSTVIQSLMC